MTIEWFIPLDDSFLFVAEPGDFLQVAFPEEGLFVIPNGGVGSWDVVCVQ